MMNIDTVKNKIFEHWQQLDFENRLYALFFLVVCPVVKLWLWVGERYPQAMLPGFFIVLASSYLAVFLTQVKKGKRG